MRSWLNRLSPIFLTLWGVAVVVGVGSLLAGHLLTLPIPDRRDPVLVSAVKPRAEKHWLALHALSLDCGCSRRVLDHLLERGAKAGIEERVLLLAGNTETANHLQKRGYQVELLDEDGLRAAYQIEAVPLFVVRDPSGSVRYLGGYSDRKRGEIEDEAILARLANGDAVAARPAFGCAVGLALRKQVDPLGLRN